MNTRDAAQFEHANDTFTEVVAPAALCVAHRMVGAAAPGFSDVQTPIATELV